MQIKCRECKETKYHARFHDGIHADEVEGWAVCKKCEKKADKSFDGFPSYEAWMGYETDRQMEKD